MAAYRLEWTRLEDGLRSITFRAIVTDTYAELFTSAEAPLVDMFRVGKLKQEIDPETARFSEDELELEMDYAMCATADDLACFTLLLEAQNPTEERFIIVFINEGAGYKQIFRGIIDPKMSGEDYLWNGAAFSITPNPARLWKMNARVYNSAVLDIKFDDFFPQEGTVDGIIDVWENANVANRKGYSLTDLRDYLDNPTGKTYGAYFGALVDLNKVLRLMLDYAELYNEAVNLRAVIDRIVLPYTFLVDKIRPWYVRRKGDNGQHVVRSVFMYTRTPKTLGRIALGDTGRDTSISPIVESSATINPEDRRPFVNYFLFRERTTLEKGLGVHTQARSLLGLFYEIARSFGLFVEFTYDDDGILHIRFVSREQVFYDDEGNLLRTYFADTEKASLSSEPVIIKASTESWVGLSNPYAVDGLETYERRTFAGDQATSTDLYKEYSSNKNRVLLTISPTLYKTSTVNGNGRNADMVNRKSTATIDYDAETGNVAIHEIWYEGEGNIYHNTVCYARDEDAETLDNADAIRMADIHTGIYAYTSDTDYISTASVGYGEEIKPYDFTSSGSYWCYRPLSGLQISVDGEIKTYNTLTDYINEMIGRDGTFIKREYSLDMPYLTRYRTVSDGAESYFNISCGRTVSLDGADWSITSLERDLDTLGTTVKLRLLERYVGSQSVPDDEDAEGILSGIDPTEYGTTVPPSIVRYYQIDEEINIGEPVILNSSGTVSRAFPTADSYGKVIGICLGSYVGDFSTVIPVCVSGICDARLQYAPGKRIWLRDLARHIGDSPISAPDADECLYQSVGYALEGGLMFVEISEPVLLEY